MSVILPNGKPGEHDIHTQRMRPLKVGELSREMAQELGGAKVMLVGPMVWSADTRSLLQHIPALAPSAFPVLIPHPSLIRDPAFPLIASRYQYIQLNGAEARSLEGATSDIALNARRLSLLIGDENACAVTNGADRGWLWAENRWLPIDPVRLQVSDDTGCGDSFAAAFIVGWGLLGLNVDAALHYANRTTPVGGRLRRSAPG